MLAVRLRYRKGVIIRRSTSIHKISKIPLILLIFLVTCFKRMKNITIFELWYLFEPFRLVPDGLQVARVLADRLDRGFT